MESTLKNMVLSLLGVTFIASFSVGIVNMITEEPIRAAQVAATQQALENVVPPFRKSSMVSVEVDGVMVDVYTMKSAKNEVLSYAVKSSAKEGYSGAITMMVGILDSGELNDVSILSHSETPGLGSKMCDEGNNLIRSVKGRDLETVDLRVKKDGGDLDALSGATITSRAYGIALARAFRAVQIVNGEGVYAAADAAEEQERKEAAEAVSQMRRMEQMMQQAKANQAKVAAEAKGDDGRLPYGDTEYLVDSSMVREIVRQLSYQRYDWFLRKVEQEYTSDKEIRRRSAQLAAVAAQRVREREQQAKQAN